MNSNGRSEESSLPSGQIILMRKEYFYIQREDTRDSNRTYHAFMDSLDVPLPMRRMRSISDYYLAKARGNDEVKTRRERHM